MSYTAVHYDAADDADESEHPDAGAELEVDSLGADLDREQDAAALAQPADHLMSRRRAGAVNLRFVSV